MRLHSPFVFNLAKQVLSDRRHYYAFDPIEARRQQLLSERISIQRVDLGAGSRTGQRRKLSSIVRSSAVSAKFGQMLFRLAAHYRPETILEMGACVGVGTAYLSAPAVHQKCITLEGDPALARIAQQTLDRFQLGPLRAEVRVGDFDELLQPALADLGRIGLAYVDGNHRKDATIDYFERILPFCHNETVLVFDDIYWSRGMSEAWDHICAHPATRITVDLYRMGLVFFREEKKEPEHFRLWF